MRTLRSVAPSLVLVAAISLSIAGCGTDGASSDRATQPVMTSTPTQLSPVEKLVDAAAKTNQGPITVVLQSPGLTSTTKFDPAAKKATMDIELAGATGGTIRANVIQVDTDLYVRMPNVPGVPKKWMHSDVADLPADSPLRLLPESDHTRAGDLTNCVVTAKRKGGSDFTGTLDLTRSRTIGRALLTALDSKAKAVPFSARTSPDGNFFEFTIDIPSVLPGYGAIRYDYSRMDGVDVDRPPASQVTEVPELPKSLLDGIAA